jgi:hypothetical protein
MSFKLAVPIEQDLALDNPEILVGLREKYPSCYYVTGQYKDKLTLFVLGDLTTRKYGEPRKLKDGSTFFPPLNDFELAPYEVAKELRQFKIQVKLTSGKSLWVKPATLEPQVYSLFDEEEQNSFSQATEYGRIAYSLFDDIQKDKDISLADPRIRKFLKLLIANSYNLPVIIIDSLNIIAASDLLNLVSAGLGINEEVLEVKKNT